MKSKFLATGLVGFCATLSGCASQDSVDIVDLNKVLDALVAVLDEPNNAAAGTVTASPPNGENTSASPEGGSDAPQKDSVSANVQPVDPVKEQEFLDLYAKKLNEVKVMEHATVGVIMQPGGEIVGFKDHNANNRQDMGETKEFTVTIDAENSRLIASDNNGNYRPHGYFPGSGFMMGYMMSSMLGRQNSYYSGAKSGAKPNFRNAQMSSPDYHQRAVQSARASAASSARARTGSKGFSFGK